MVDPDNEDRLLKIPPSVVAEIQAEARIEWGMSNGPAFDYARGYAAALHQAREAVAALRGDVSGWTGQSLIYQHTALAAIAALKDTHITNITKEEP
jgi:hypothetical protein